MKEIKSKNVMNYVMNDMVWKVDLPLLLKEIAECSKSTPYPVTFTILTRVLGILAERAIEINDPALNIIMMNLGLYEGVHDKNAGVVISRLRKLITDNKKRRANYGNIKKETIMYLWIARDERQQHPKYHDELELHGKLHVFYDSPILKNGKWTLARQLGGEIPSYMFPELKECCCQKFIGMIGDLENKLPKVIEFINIDNRKE